MREYVAKALIHKCRWRDHRNPHLHRAHPLYGGIYTSEEAKYREQKQRRHPGYLQHHDESRWGIKRGREKGR